jgi:two-component system, chemotaxis family, CheB/CheR fusion protein
MPPPEPAPATPERAQGAPCGVVGIGASAGGLQALETFFQYLAHDSGLGFVIVQHLDPDRPSIMPELVARFTPMVVRHVKDQAPIEPDHVYLIEPNTTLTLEGGTLRATTPIEPRHTPIDTFFRSLASAQGERAIGIVLSGGGSDGTLGLQAIHEHGGVTMAQEGAQHDSMPRSAIARGVVDYVLPVEQMPAALLERAGQLMHAGSAGGQPGPLEGATDVEGHLRRIAVVLQRRTGHDFSRYKQATVVRRVQRRMQVRQAGSIDAYLELLEDPEEATLLFQSLLISVTQFFRDPEAFDFLAREIVPTLFARKGPDEDVRVWVPGCASGEEAYSIAILLREEAWKLKVVPAIKIFATDIDAAALATARLGRYPESIADQVTPTRLSRSFVKVADGYQIGKDVRDLCVFSSHNVIADPPFSRLDLLCCRNVLIYLEGELQKRLVPLFHYALRSRGVLFLGPSESLSGYAELFRTRDKKHRIYERADAPLAPASMLPPAEPLRLLRSQSPALPQQPPTRDQAVLKSIERVLLDQYAPAAVVVSPRGEIIHVFGRTGKYLELSPGTTARPNVLDMAGPGLRPHLHAALRSAVETRELTVHADMSIEHHGQVQRLNLIVRPLTHLALDAELFLVIFQELGSLLSREQAAAEGVVPRPGQPLADEVEIELRNIKENLRTTVEELKTSNEDLKSANEELLSMNEELQSSNEELQTSKEEMQSINEEMQTVNAELHRKVEDLDRAHGDLQNLFTSTQIATLFLDHDLCIKRFSPAAKSVFRIIESDAGRPITDLTAAFTDPELVADAREVLQTLEPRERQVHRADGDLWYIRRVRPYRSLENTIEGVVITLIDVTDLKLAQAQVVHLATIVKSSQEAILGLTLEGTISSWNAGAERIYGYTAAETVGRPYAMLIPEDRTAEMAHAYERLKRGELFAGFETTRVRKDGQPVSVHLTLSSVVDASGALIGISAIAHDISGRVRAEEALKEADRHKNDFLAMLGHELRNPLAPIRTAAEILRDFERGEPTVVKALNIVERQVQHMTRLIDDLLDLSRVSRGKILLRKEPSDLTAVTRTSVDDSRSLVEAGGLTLEVGLPDRPLHVLGDPARLAQIVDNLLGNAVKFTDAGGRIAVHLDADGDGGAVILRIRDTGIGMEASTLSHVFEPFVQADRTLNRSRGGLGLGLALVKTLVELHDGTITAASDGLGRGAELTLRLPLLQAPTPAPAPPTTTRAAAHPRRILIIEDNFDAAETLKLLLTRKGHDVAMAHTGADGIDLAKARTPEVVLCDVGLPGEIDGYAVARALRADPSTASIHIVALTGYGQDGDRHLTAEAGFDAHLVKPAELSAIEKLLAAVR